MKDHIISAYTIDGIWLLGTVDEYPFQVKVCDEPSSFGIECGRVIKLHIGAKVGHGEVAAYERGWDLYPKGANKGLTQAVILFAESLPCQDIWRHSFRQARRFLVTPDDVLEYE